MHLSNLNWVGGGYPAHKSVCVRLKNELCIKLPREREVTVAQDKSAATSKNTLQFLLELIKEKQQNKRQMNQCGLLGCGWFGQHNGSNQN